MHMISLVLVHMLIAFSLHDNTCNFTEHLSRSPNLFAIPFDSNAVSMSSNVKEDHEEQLFYDPAMVRDPKAQTLLLGVVDSESFADSDIDYYVGEGGLAGIIGVPSSPAADLKSYTDGRWSILKQKLDFVKEINEERKPIFCWMDPNQPRIEALANDAQWLQVDDVVGPLGAETDTHTSLHAGIPWSGFAIMLKICGALAHMGYSSDVVSKVAGLVQRNMMTSAHYGRAPLETKSSELSQDTLEARIQALLTGMLTSKSSSTRSVNMNSNEPVLLVNNFGGLRQELVRGVVRTSLEQLQQSHNIWPVRVYAGPFLVGDVDEEYRHNGFSVTLLNVVNTEIGGPSMVDLLDHPCKAPIWSYGLGNFSKEVWRDRHLIDKFETAAALSRSSSSDSIAQQSEASLASEDSVSPPKTFEAQRRDGALVDRTATSNLDEIVSPPLEEVAAAPAETENAWKMFEPGMTRRQLNGASTTRPSHTVQGESPS